MSVLMNSLLRRQLFLVKRDSGRLPSFFFLYIKTSRHGRKSNKSPKKKAPPPV